MNPALLLTDQSACLRALVLRHLIDDAHSQELAYLDERRPNDPLAADLVGLQSEDGHWGHGDGAWRGHSYPLMMTCMALLRLALLGFDSSYLPVASGAAFLFGKQRKDGSWPLARATDDSEGVNECPLQTAIPLRALAACGYAEDPRCERAFQWLDKRRLDDGAWPTGMAKGDFRGVAGYRRIAHSRLGCRSNTTAVLQCLALHPSRRSTPDTQRTLDLLLGRDTRDAYSFGFDLARLLGAEPLSGFIAFYARYDAVTILELCARVGAQRDDERVRDLVDFVISQRGPGGMWSYAGAPQIERWLTYHLLRVLNDWQPDADWVTFEARTPFRATRTRRF